jgi:translation initiation factor 2 subunit 1
LSRRRIRSINKLIRVGKSECVSVLRVDRDKGYIDLSKRRVSADQLKATTERYNKGKVVHAIMRTVAEKLNLSLIDLNRMITWPLARSKMFPHPRDAFVMAIQDPDTIFEELKRVSAEYLGQLEERLQNLRNKEAAGENEVLDAGHHRGGKDEEEEEEEEMAAEDMEASIAVMKKSIGGLPEDIKAMLLANIKRRLTPQPIKIRADVDVSCYSYQGIDAVKNALREAKKFGSNEFPMTISLIAPPQYTIQTTSLEKKEGIDRCNQAVEAVRASILAAGGRLAVKMQAKATTSRDEEELARHLATMAAENNEVDGDED